MCNEGNLSFMDHLYAQSRHQHGWCWPLTYWNGQNEIFFGYEEQVTWLFIYISSVIGSNHNNFSFTTGYRRHGLTIKYQVKSEVKCVKFSKFVC